jgi:hypothetical protein
MWHKKINFYSVVKGIYTILWEQFVEDEEKDHCSSWMDRADCESGMKDCQQLSEPEADARAVVLTNLQPWSVRPPFEINFFLLCKIKCAHSIEIFKNSFSFY